MAMDPSRLDQQWSTPGPGPTPKSILRSAGATQKRTGKSPGEPARGIPLVILQFAVEHLHGKMGLNGSRKVIFHGKLLDYQRVFKMKFSKHQKHEAASTCRCSCSNCHYILSMDHWTACFQTNVACLKYMEWWHHVISHTLWDIIKHILKHHWTKKCHL